MAYTTIDNPSEYFNIVLWTGDASSDKSISGVGFQPDWVWAKNRSDSNDHQMIDSNRGAGKILRPNSTGAELTRSSDVGAGGLQNFESDGFDVHSTSTNTNLNDNGELNVGWCWKANGGTLTTNDASATSVGTHDSQYQANTTAGFSIVTWTGNAEQETLAHGLGATPEMIWIKNRSDTEGWWVGATPAGAMSDGKYLLLNQTAAVDTNSTSFVNQNPTSTVFRVGGSNSTADNAINGNSDNMIAYCFTSIQGYSKIGSYIGNGNADGPFVYTGFKPAWLLFKQSSANGENWRIFDNKRSPFNQVDDHLFASSNSVENDETGCDFLSNGFKWKNSDAHQNGNGATYVYMAFAEHPFVSSKGVPVTAR